MTKKVYIITGCVVAAILLGMLAYLLATASDRKHVKDLQEAVSEFNSDGELTLPEGCYEYRTVYDPNNNMVSIEYFFTHNRFENEGFGVMDDHPDVKDEWAEIIEEQGIKSSSFSKILKLMVNAKASLRVRFIDKGEKKSLVFKWSPNDLKKLSGVKK